MLSTSALLPTWLQVCQRRVPCTYCCSVVAHGRRRWYTLCSASPLFRASTSRPRPRGDQCRGVVPSPRSLSAHRKAISMQLSTEDNHKNRFEKENIWTIPNVLSTARIALSPVLGYLVLQEHYTLGLILFLVAGVSDIVDGAIARNYKNQASRLGSILDPLADKCLVATLSICLTKSGLIPVVLTGVILARDVILIGGSFYLRYITLPPPHTWSKYWDIQRSTVQVTPSTLGKLNTVLQLSLVGLSLGAPVLGYVNHPLLQMLWCMTGFTTILSGFNYIMDLKGFKVLR